MNNREIKFRGKTLDGIWFHWNLLDPINMEEMRGAIKEETVGQSTGLKDKNGKEIYEGDIIEMTNMAQEKIRFDIRWSERAVGTTWAGFMQGVRGGVLNRDDIETCAYEVIGNIHEHPHLLGGK